MAPSSLLPVVKALSQDIEDVENFLGKLILDGLSEIVIMLYEKKLTGPRIMELYELCDCNLHRFAYHVGVELPFQETGMLHNRIARSYLFRMGLDDEQRQFHHFEARKHGKPGSFWALKNPPQEKDYGYPIFTFVFEFVISKLPWWEATI